MSHEDTILASVLQLYVERILSLKEGLLSAIQYGSTARGTLKHETDIDLLLIFQTLPPGRMQRSQLLEEIESQCMGELCRLLPKDFNLCFSSKLKTVDESQRFSLLYLDMVDRSRILYDPQGLAAALLAKTRDWIQRSGAYRVEKGLKWYWVLGKDVTWKQESTVGW